MLEAQQLARMKPPPSTSAPAVARTGEFDDKFIRLGEEYQVEVPGFDEASPPEDTYPGGRADVLVEIDFTPLDEPPPPVPIRTLKEVKAERAAKEAAEREAALRGSEGGAESDEDLDDFDEAGEPRVPAGVEMGGFCRAMGKRAGERIPFKAVLLSTRRTAPPLLVRYVGTVDGREGSAILLPESTKGYLSYREVKRWVAPPPAPAGVVASFGLPSAAAERVFRTRLPPKGALELLTEAGGLRLYLDDRRMMDGYAGTGYEGVSYDYWPTGYKKLKPYVVTFEGSYAGRFATVEQAAVQYARLEEGLPPMSFDARAEFEASVYE